MSFPAPLPKDDPTLSVHFDLPEALTYITLLRRTSRCLTDSLKMRREDAEDIELLLGELATNAARHSQATTYGVQMDFFPLYAVITVSDQGIGFAREAVPEPGTARPDVFAPGDEARIGGYGLPLVHALADKVAVQSHEGKGTTVRIEKWYS